MIQRIQTVFLIAGAMSISAIFWLDEIWTGPAGDGSMWFTAVTLGIFGICVVGAILSVFLYKDRKRQRSVVILLQVFTVLGLLTMFVGEYLGDTLPFVGTESDGTIEGFGLALAAFGYALFYFARRESKRISNLFSR